MINEAGIIALKKEIRESQVMCRLTKRVLLYLMIMSGREYEEVCLTLSDGGMYNTAQLSAVVRDFVSRRHPLLQRKPLVGPGLCFSSHFGRFVFNESSELLKRQPRTPDSATLMHTFWLSGKWHSPKARHLGDNPPGIQSIPVRSCPLDFEPSPPNSSMDVAEIRNGGLTYQFGLAAHQ